MRSRPLFVRAAAWTAATSLLACASAVQPAALTQTFRQSGSDGCGLFLVYAWNADRTEAIIVEADQLQLRLADQPVTIDLADPATGVRVHHDIYNQSQDRFDYCSDLKRPLSEPKPRRSPARSGQLTIEIRDRVRVSVRLQGLVFDSADGTHVKFDAPVLIVAAVGGFSG